ncbi:MAG: Ribonuclease BN? [uncultured Pseudonocardia sp.]|uniref:Ribonuclease BN n=1 Tax=uncultured Pseudonocardia sp. TaxID=211455 RepID=A0A6J4NHQ2_9PSEU|nr:MAG: Ribonuclease BN? [uncultured Pseudonocardia sp.]
MTATRDQQAEAGPARPAGSSPAAPGGPLPRNHAVRRVVTRTARRAWDDDILTASASAAFWQTLSLPPLLLGLFGLLGYVGAWFGPGTVDAVQLWIIDTTSGFFSRNAIEEILVPTVSDVLTSARGGVVSLGFVLSLWSGSSAMAAFVDSISRAHDQYQLRHPVWQRILPILLYVVSLAAGIVLLPLVALGPDRLRGLLPAQAQPAAAVLLGGAMLPIVGVVLLLALTTLYRLSLPLKPPWHRGLPGALLATVVFLGGVSGLRVYLDWVAGTGYTYGALAAPIAFLLATFCIAFAIILGAHFNAAVQAVHPAPLRRRGRPATIGPTHPPGLAGLVRQDPDGAVEVLEQLGYAVRPPVEAEDPATEGPAAAGPDSADGPADDCGHR